MKIHLKKYIYMALLSITTTSSIKIFSADPSPASWWQRTKGTASQLPLPMFGEFLNQLLKGSGVDKLLSSHTSIEFFPRIQGVSGDKLRKNIMETLELNPNQKTVVGCVLNELTISNNKYIEIKNQLKLQYTMSLCKELKLDPDFLTPQEQELIERTHKQWMHTPEFAQLRNNALNRWISLHLSGSLFAARLNKQFTPHKFGSEDDSSSGGASSSVIPGKWYNDNIGIAVCTSALGFDARVEAGCNPQTRQFSASANLSSDAVPVISYYMPTRVKLEVNRTTGGNTTFLAKLRAILFHTELIGVEGIGEVKKTDKGIHGSYGIRFSAGE